MSIHSKYRFPFASYPAVRIALLISLGITANYIMHPSNTFWGGTFLSLTAIYGIAEFIHRRKLKSQAYNFAIIAYLGMLVAFGGLWHSLFDSRQPPVASKALDAYTWQELTFSGTVQQIKETGTGKFQVDVQVDTTRFAKDLRWTESYQLRAVLDPAETAFPKELKIGRYLKFSATVYPLEGKRNPHDFNYKKYLASVDIYNQAGIQHIVSIRKGNHTLSWTPIRRKVLWAIDNNFSKETAPLAKALLIGYKNELDRNQKIAFSRAGLSHIMAVSGLHVGFILAPFWLAIPLFWTFKYGKKMGLLLLIIMLFFYAGLTGFSASVSRASLAGGFLIYGRLFHKVRDAKNLTAVAAIIILLINPNDLFSIGFQLSFSAVYIILLTTSVIYRWLPNWIQYRWYGKPVMVIIISFIVQIGLFPFLAYYFGEFSLVGPLANAFVIPFLGFVVPFALLLLPLSVLFPVFVHYAIIPVDYFLIVLNDFVTFSSGLEWSWIQVSIYSLSLFGIWLSAILFIAALRIPKLRWKMLCLFLLMITINQIQHVVQKLRPDRLRITVFDVGQGDATLVSTPKNKHFLIDTGRWQPGYNSAKYVILPHLKAEGINKLDAVFLSHPHADHIGGMPELIDHIPIDTIYNSGSSYNSALFSSYQQKAAHNGIPIISLAAGDEVRLDSSIGLFIYGPEASSDNHNVNNRSLILELIYGETEFLFTGDAEAPQERQLVRDYPKLADTDFLKVGHHGSKTSSTNALLDDITAEQGAVSLAKQNHFKHPSPEAIRRLRHHHIRLHFTSLEGALQFASDGKQIWIKK